MGVVVRSGRVGRWGVGVEGHGVPLQVTTRRHGLCLRLFYVRGGVLLTAGAFR